MRSRLVILSLALICARAALAGVSVSESSVSACRWVYEPGKPNIERPDTINGAGVILEWQDTGFRISDEFVQPVCVFNVAVPPGTTPHLRILSQQSSHRDQGLPGRSPFVTSQYTSPHSQWAELEYTANWRGYRLARIEVSQRIGDDKRSETLERLSLEVTFSGTPTPAPNGTRDAEFVTSMAINGRDASTWWQPQRTLQRPSRSLDDWPDITLYRLGVEETGLYRVTGTTLRSRGANLVGQPSSSIKLFGNGGGLLPKLPSSPTDSVLKEVAILMFDGGDGVFDESDSILFYGHGVKGFNYTDSTYLNDLAHQSPFTRENIYFIGADAGGTPGLRMAPMSTSGGTPVNWTPGREYVDNDLFIYAANAATTSGLVWYMYSMNPGEHRPISIFTDAALGDSAVLTVDMEDRNGSMSTGVDISIDDNMVSQNRFSNLPMRIPVAPGIVTPGIHNVDFYNHSSHTIYINFLELEFTRSITLSSGTGTLEFYSPPGQSGIFQYTVQDLPANGYILDVSNVVTPRYAVGNSISDSAGSPGSKTYFAVRLDRLKSPAFRGAKDPGGTADYRRLRDPSNRGGLIMITYDGWFDALQPLKEFHEHYREEPFDGRTVRVKLTDIYDEFGWGVHDVVAIRDFLKYAYENWRGPNGTDTLKYVLFVGDGDYDYRNLISPGDDNWMPPWEWADVSNDDFFAIFDDDNNAWPQLFTGRWPVQSQSEVDAATAKSIAYANDPLYSPWKSSATFAADDEWKNGGCGEQVHSIQSESLINDILPSYFTFNKVYEILYPVRATPTGPQKPEATSDLLDAIHRGTLIVDYRGHGNERIWSDEQLFVMDRDHNLLDNYRMWPLFVAATCSWGAFDQVGERCFPEVLLSDERDGAIASLGATRVTYSGSNDSFSIAFYRELFRQGLIARRSFGEALTIGKIATNNTNARLYHVFGDPVLRLATPERFARVTARDDSMQALSLFHLSGVVSQVDSGPTWGDFQGVVEARVYDTQDSGVYYWPDTQNCDLRSNNAFYYGLEGNSIFRGKATVHNGEFSLAFRVPRDVRYGASNARISLYFYGNGGQQDSADGIGIEQPVLIANEAAAEVDSVAPSISLWLESASFRSGDPVSATPLLHVDVADSSGINLSGEVGHRITVRVDDAATQDLTQFFNYRLDSYTTGSLERAIGPLSVGEHHLLVEAWDSFNNLNQASIAFTVGQSGEGGYDVKDVLNWPNPMTDRTYFTYYLTQDGTSRVSIKVYTLTGKLVWEGDGFGTAMAFNSNNDLPWDGRDREGHMLGNGVYLYKVRATNLAGHTAEATGKLVILR